MNLVENIVMIDLEGIKIQPYYFWPKVSEGWLETAWIELNHIWRFHFGDCKQPCCLY